LRVSVCRIAKQAIRWSTPLSWRRTGEGNAYGLDFGPTNVGLWRMSVALESRDYTQAASIGVS
jgi:hypothetical protein